MRQKNAFTLIEIIVVLVVIAFLATALIPQLFGFVEHTRSRLFASEARIVYLAAQAYVTDKLATDPRLYTPASMKADMEHQINREHVLYHMLQDDATGTITRIDISDRGKVTKLIYKDKTGKYILALTPGKKLESSPITTGI